MSEVAAATPAPEQPALEYLVAAHNANVPLLIRELAAARRALDAAKVSPHRELSDAMLLAFERRIADVQWAEMNLGEDIKKAAAVQSLRDLMGRRAELAPAGPESELVRHRHRRTRARTERRHLGLAPGAGGLIPAGAAAFRGLRLKPPPLHALLSHKALLTAGAGAALITVAAGSMPSSHLLPDITGTWHAPAAVIYHSEPIPVLRLPSSLPTDAFVRPEKHPVKPRKPVPAVVVSVPVPVPSVPAPAPAPAVTAPPSQPQDTSGGSGSDDSSQPSGWSQPSQAPDYRAQGKHASQWSGEGNSGYQGGHRGNGGGQDWQQGNAQPGNWQGGQQQDGSPQNATWQSGSGQGNGQQGGGNWQGGGQRGGR